jgi:hypothetical protein
MLVVSGPNGRAANIALNRWAKDTVCIQTCKRAAQQRNCCPVYEQGCLPGNLRVYSAAAFSGSIGA